MEMCYDGTLVMPSSYAVMDEEEMTYVEGGWCIENKLWGYNIYLTHKERQLLSAGQTIAGIASGLASFGVGTAILGAFANIVANYDNGYGVKIRMLGPLKIAAVCAGVVPLTKSQQKSFAKRNDVIF